MNSQSAKACRNLVPTDDEDSESDEGGNATATSSDITTTRPTTASGVAPTFRFTVLKRPTRATSPTADEYQDNGTGGDSDTNTYCRLKPGGQGIRPISAPSNSGTGGGGLSSLSLEEREIAYEEARRRIFGSSSSSLTDNNNAVSIIPTTSSSCSPYLNKQYPNINNNNNQFVSPTGGFTRLTRPRPFRPPLRQGVGAYYNASSAGLLFPGVPEMMVDSMPLYDIGHHDIPGRGRGIMNFLPPAHVTPPPPYNMGCVTNTTMPPPSSALPMYNNTFCQPPPPCFVPTFMAPSSNNTTTKTGTAAQDYICLGDNSMMKTSELDEGLLIQTDDKNNNNQNMVIPHSYIPPYYQNYSPSLSIQQQQQQQMLFISNNNSNNGYRNNNLIQNIGSRLSCPQIPVIESPPSAIQSTNYLPVRPSSASNAHYQQQIMNTNQITYPSPNNLGTYNKNHNGTLMSSTSNTVIETGASNLASSGWINNNDNNNNSKNISLYDVNFPPLGGS